MTLKSKWWRPISKKRLVYEQQQQIDKAPISEIQLKNDYFNISQTQQGFKIFIKYPHLICQNKIVHSSLKIYPLKYNGQTNIGSSKTSDIEIDSNDVDFEHCYIEVYKTNGHLVAILYPLAELCSVDGVLIDTPYKLRLGNIICIGTSNYFQYNEPFEVDINTKFNINFVKLEFDKFININNNSNNKNNKKMTCIENKNFLNDTFQEHENKESVKDKKKCKVRFNIPEEDLTTNKQDKLSSSLKNEVDLKVNKDSIKPINESKLTIDKNRQWWIPGYGLYKTFNN